jgi:hypothetical protein
VWVWWSVCRGRVVWCRGVFCLRNCRVLYDVRILVSIVVSIPACHAGDPGSIPGREAFAFFCRAFLLLSTTLSPQCHTLTGHSQRRGRTKQPRHTGTAAIERYMLHLHQRDSTLGVATDVVEKRSRKSCPACRLARRVPRALRDGLHVVCAAWCRRERAEDG